MSIYWHCMLAAAMASTVGFAILLTVFVNQGKNMDIPMVLFLSGSAFWFLVYLKYPDGLVDGPTIMTHAALCFNLIVFSLFLLPDDPIPAKSGIFTFSTTGWSLAFLIVAFYRAMREDGGKDEVQSERANTTPGPAP